MLRTERLLGFAVLTLGLAYGQFQSGINLTVNNIRDAAYCADTSVSANTITCSTQNTFSGYSAGQAVDVLLANTITGAATINVDTRGPKAVTYNGSVPLISGILTAGGTYRLQYDGTRFVLQGAMPATHGLGASFSGAAIAAGQTTYFPIRNPCVIQAWNVQLDDGTNTNTCAGCSITYEVWFLASTTNNPTVADSINTSGLTSSATRVRSTTLTDFTTTSLAANTTGAISITATSGAPAFANLFLECQ